jgi:outer membrane receptor protein involved in Fe transport
MKRNKNKARLLALSVLFAPTLTMAATSELVLEEVVVTAQKRMESSQDVPISLVALGGDKLRDAGIQKIDDLTAYVPNIHMTETGISTQLRIRGIGSGNNQGFEQSVGQYIDGIYYGRAQLIRAPFLDLERVEVLRGPQGILFGKNSIAGALNMTSAKPTDTWEGSVSVSYTPETEGEEIIAVISGPLTDSLRGRLAYRSFEEDGYVENVFKDEDEPNRDEDAIRLTLAWDATEDLEFILKVERDTFDVKGRQIEIVQDDKTRPFPDPPAAPLAFLNYNDILTNPAGFNQPGFDDELDYKRDANADEFSNNELNNVTLTMNWGLGNNTLTLISGWVSYDYDDICDCDYTAADVFTVPLSEEYEQFSQEIRLTSPGGETFDWIVGAFYQSSEQDFSDSITVGDNSIIDAGVAQLAPGLPQINGTRAEREFTQDSDLWAVFGQTTWSITDALRLTLGGRYTSEDKTGSRELNILNEDGTPNVFGSATYKLVFAVESEQCKSIPVPPFPAPANCSAGHNLKGDRSESAFTPVVNVQYDFNEEIMGYVSFTKGFKAGGYDARANNVDSFEFDEEEATSSEVGLKTTLADGRAEINVAYFYTDYDDLQISQFDGTLGFNVGNAKKTTVQGWEVEGRWRIIESLTMSFAGAYLDAEYKDFKNGNCYVGESTVGGAILPGGVQGCDYTGKTPGYAPKYSANLGFDHSLSLGDALMLNSSLDMQYVDEQNVHPNLDPQYEIDAYSTVDARVALETDHWSVAVLGKNLTDEEVLSYAGNVPLSGTFGATGTYYGFVKRPRTVTIEARYSF